MHELSFALAVISQAEAVITREVEKGVISGNGAPEILSLKLAVGELSGVDCDALRLSLELAAPGTVLAKARIDIERVKAVLECSECHGLSEKPDLVWICGHCGSAKTALVRGKDVRICEIEVE